MGQQVARTARDILPVKLNLAGYLYGCVIPDLWPRYANIPHQKEASLNLLSSLLSRSLRTIPQSPKALQHYSINLGIITHYICDYFCQAHNRPLYSNPWHHFIYESKLAKACRHTDLKGFTTPLIIPFDPGSPNCPLLPYLDYKHKDYLKHKPEIYVDISYSLQISSTIILSILYSTLNGSRHQAA